MGLGERGRSAIRGALYGAWVMRASVKLRLSKMFTQNPAAVFTNF